MDCSGKYENHIATEKTKELLSLFEHFIDICKCPSWPDNTTDSKEIIKSFEIAFNIEKCISDQNGSSSFCIFLKLFTKYYNHKHKREIDFGHVVFDKAADYVLEKFLTRDLQLNIANIALTEYMNKFGEPRLQKILKELILSSTTSQALKTHLDSKELDKEDEINLRCELFLNDLQNKFELIEDIIKNMLLNGDNLNHLETVCRSLLCKNASYNDEIIKVEKCFCNLLAGSNSASIWKSFLIDLDKLLLADVSKKYPNISKEIVLHIIQCSSHIFSEKMGFNTTVWIVNRKTSPSPDLTYNIIVDLVKLLTKKCNKIHCEFTNMVKSSLQNPPFWSAVFKDCGINNDELWKNLESFFDEDIFVDD